MLLGLMVSEFIPATAGNSVKKKENRIEQTMPGYEHGEKTPFPW